MKRNIIVVNLGSPVDPSPEAVGTYLKEFLMDPFVIDSPFPLRWILVKLLIVPKRKFRSAEAYQKVWTEKGSPLIENTESFVRNLRALKPDWDIRSAMRYGGNRLSEVLPQFLKEVSGPIDIIPLYPQYAKSSTGTCWDIARKVAKKLGAENRVRVWRDFYEEPHFIKAFHERVSDARVQFDADGILFSYHGLPESHVKETDLTGQHCLKVNHCCEQITEVNRNCYRAQCFQTTKALVKSLDLKPQEYQISFQSRLGRQPWIKPYTDVVLKDLAEKGKKRLLIVCPSFVADCLETLEEIQIQAKEDFISLGGEDLRLVPSLNDSQLWAKGFIEMLEADKTSLLPVTRKI